MKDIRWFLHKNNVSVIETHDASRVGSVSGPGSTPPGVAPLFAGWGTLRCSTTGWSRFRRSFRSSGSNGFVRTMFVPGARTCESGVQAPKGPVQTM